MRHIIIDTREKRPWDFPQNVPVKRQALNAGDYAIEGDCFFAIERKSLQDFLGTIFADWERFKREIARMNAAHFVAKVVIVEADFEDFLYTMENGEMQPPKYESTFISPQAILSRIAELTLMNVSVLFCKNADCAASMAQYLLLNRLKMLEKIKI